MRDYRPYVLPDGTEIPGHWHQDPERFVATEYGWKKLTMWACNRMILCSRVPPRNSKDPTCWNFGSEFHHKHGRGGGKRDDRLESLEWLCRPCHRKTAILPRKQAQ